MTMTDKNCLSYWFPKIEAASLPVPKTIVVRTDLPLSSILDGDAVDGWDAFIDELRAAAERIGYPIFLRTGHGSGKHEWRRTCHVPDAEAMPHRVARLVEWSEMAGVLGLPTNVWAVREMLPTMPQFTAFLGMPICREFRLFVRDAEVLCCHPYWTKKSLEEGMRKRPAVWDQGYECLCYLQVSDEALMVDLASRAGAAVDRQYWSVDVLETARGWYVTDMALAENSFHWPGCSERKIP